ncbi:MAG TPA: GAF domain-containing protein [Kofleriaceae bacterium]|nr:GAF domain-containing protein [Kofleriaceae bacterium]
MARDPGSTLTSTDIDVHVSGRDRSVDGILRLIEIAGQERPLMELLGDMCPHIADIASADVVSVYVREGERLVMRGNIGFPGGAVGRVALRVGEGITGMVAECMRPVSVAVAGQHDSYEHVPGLGEERFPAFVGVPLLGAGRVTGVLVAQRRRAEAFGAAEIALLTALGAPVALAIDQARRRSADSRRGRSARLTGLPLAGGSAMGRVSPIPNLTGLADPPAGEAIDLAAAFVRLTGDLERASRHLRDERDPEVRRALVNLELALVDQRFRERLLEARGGLVSGLRELARDYARVPYRVPVRGGAIEPAMAERAREIEDLCVLLHAAATGAPLLSPGGVWVGERVGAFTALCAVARGAAAIVCAERMEPGPAAAIARAARVPLLTEVDALYAWVRPGDLVVVDADKGILRVNPTASSVESFRRSRARR